MLVWGTWDAFAIWTVWCSSFSWLPPSGTTCSVLTMASQKSSKSSKVNKLTITWCINYKNWSLTWNFLREASTTPTSSASHSKSSTARQQMSQSKRTPKSSSTSSLIDSRTLSNQPLASISSRVSSEANSAVKWSAQSAERSRIAWRTTLTFPFQSRASNRLKSLSRSRLRARLSTIITVMAATGKLTFKSEAWSHLLQTSLSYTYSESALTSIPSRTIRSTRSAPSPMCSIFSPILSTKWWPKRTVSKNSKTPRKHQPLATK